jgi:predicted TPR repeat methyltransferase
MANYDAGRFEEAERVCRRWLAVDPGNAQITHLISALTNKDVPSRCSDAYVSSHFNDFADSFDKVLLGRLNYQGPQIVARLLCSYRRPGLSPIDVLDAGCGTGLCGPLIRHHCKTLVGVDLASKMLDRARARSCYDQLSLEEVCAFMKSRPTSFNAIVSADVLIYFGDLSLFMQAAWVSLKESGLLIVTTEKIADTADGYSIQSSGRYAHGSSYLRAVLGVAGFELLNMAEYVIRQEAGRNVMGHGLVAQKTDPNST